MKVKIASDIPSESDGDLFVGVIDTGISKGVVELSVGGGGDGGSCEWDRNTLKNG